MGLTLTVVGSSAAWSERPCLPSSAYLVEVDDAAVLLDLGQGAFASLFALRDPSTLTAVVISHEHGDHHVDLIPLRHLLRFGYDEARSIGLHAPPGLRERYDLFTGEAGFLDDLRGADLVAGVREVGPFLLQTQPVTHSQMSHAFRITERRRPDAPGLVYSGDCGRADDLLPLISAGDTLLCEAFWSTRQPVPSANHLTAAQAGEVARQSGAGRLVLTHILDAHDPGAALAVAGEVFPGPVELAVPDLVVEVGRRE